LPLSDDSKLLIRFPVQGIGTDKILEWSINSAYLTSTDGWSATLLDPNLESLDGFELEPVVLLVDDASQVVGRVDITTIGDKGSAETIEGRDYIADMVECNVDPTLKITQGMSLFDAITLAASPVGIDTVVSVDDIALRNIRTGIGVKAKKPPKSFQALKAEDLKPEVGQGIYEFLNKFVARHGATLQPTDSRTTVGISAPNYNQEPIGEIVRTDDTVASGRNNVISGVARRDFSRFPTFAIFNGRHAKSGASSKGASQQIDVSEAAFGFNPDIARAVTNAIIPGRRKPGNSASLGNGELYRLLSFKDDDARNAAQLEKAALRAVSERIKDLLTYNCTLRGHRDPKSGALWTVDTMVQCEDRIARVSEPMWIAERTLRFSPQEGALTDLVLWRKGAFVI
jgi:hypothetical protein